MKPYTFFKHDGLSKRAVFEVGEFESNWDAECHARLLLIDGPQYEAVAVWDGKAEPFTVRRQHG